MSRSQALVSRVVDRSPMAGATVAGVAPSIRWPASVTTTGRSAEPPRLQVGSQAAALGQEVDAADARHPLVGPDERQAGAPLPELGHHFERLFAAPGPYHPVAAGVVPPEVAGDRAQHGRFVVDRQ